MQTVQTISSGLTLSAARQGFDTLPQGGAFVVVTTPLAVTLREDDDGLDMVRARLVIDPFTHETTWHIQQHEDAPDWMRAVLVAMLPTDKCKPTQLNMFA